MRIILDSKIKELLECKDVYHLREGLLTYEDKNVRAQAAIALGNFKDSNTVETLCKAVENDEDKFVKAMAVLSLGDIGEIATEPLIKYCENPDWFVRMYVVEALGNLQTKEVIESLEKLSEDENLAVQGNAKKSLKNIKNKLYSTSANEEKEFDKLLDYEKEHRSKDVIEKTLVLKERILTYGIFFLFIAFTILLSTLLIYFRYTLNLVPLICFFFGFLLFFYYGVTFFQLALLKIDEKSIIFYRGKKLKFKIKWGKVTKIETVWGGKGQFSKNSGGIIINVDKMKFYIGDLDFNQNNIRRAFENMTEYAKKFEIEIDDVIGLLKIIKSGKT